jgi:hypothetical protein
MSICVAKGVKCAFDAVQIIMNGDPKQLIVWDKLNRFERTLGVLSPIAAPVEEQSQFLIDFVSSNSRFWALDKSYRNVQDLQYVVDRLRNGIYTPVDEQEMR